MASEIVVVEVVAEVVVEVETEVVVAIPVTSQQYETATVRNVVHIVPKTPVVKIKAE